MSSWRLFGGLSEAVFAAWGGALQQQQQARVDFTRPADAYDSRREAVLSGSGTENDGFDLQTSYAAPLRPVLPRFPLLPVAMCLDHVRHGQRCQERECALRPRQVARAAGQREAVPDAAGAAIDGTLPKTHKHLHHLG